VDGLLLAQRPCRRSPGNRYFVPSVDIHLARSDDEGATWRLQRSLIDSYRDHDVEGDRQIGFTGHEVGNILPVERDGGTSWYAVWLDYFVPDESGVAGRPLSSIRIRVTRADSPGGLGDPIVATLGAAATAPGWDIDTRLTDLASIDPPVLARGLGGHLKVRCVVTASDQVSLGPGASGYDPASATAGAARLECVRPAARRLANSVALGDHRRTGRQRYRQRRRDRSNRGGNIRQLRQRANSCYQSERFGAARLADPAQ